MMGKTPTQAKHVPSTNSTSATHSQAERMQLLVCIEDDHRSAGAISHVQTIAQALGGDVVLLHFLEAAEKGGAPLDPVDWEIRRRVANDVLTNLAQKYQTADHAIQVAVLEGRRIDQLCGYAARHPGGITAFGRIEGAEEIVEVSLPVVLTCEKGLVEPRYPALPKLIQAKKKPLDEKTANDYGVDVSPRLEIVKTTEPAERQAGEMVGSVDDLVAKLKEKGLV